MKNSLFIFALFLYSITCFAQQRWSVEFRPGLNFPTEDLGEDKLKVGFGFDAKIAYKMMPHLKAYAGWSWNEFKVDSQFPLPNVTLDERGYTFGFELRLPITEPPLTYYVFGGGIYNFIEIEYGTEGNIMRTKTERNLGWQLGAGLEYSILPEWAIRPEIRFHSLSGDLRRIGLPNMINLNYIAVGVGILREF